MNELGQDINFEFSETATQNINRLLKLLKIRLGDGKIQPPTDNIGYVPDHTTENCVYTTENLLGFLILSLSDLNQIPFFTFYTFDDTKYIEFFTELLVTGATLYALSSKALIEKGREFQISDNGITFDPPTVSEILNTQYSILLQHHFEKLKLIKNNTLNLHL